MSLKAELEQANGRAEALEALVALLMKEVERLTFVINQNFIMTADEYCAQFAPSLSPKEIEAQAIEVARVNGANVEEYLRINGHFKFSFFVLHQLATGVHAKSLEKHPHADIHLH